MRTLFRDIVKILHHFQIDYYASGGTLLAITRHNALNIPDDDDMDLHCDWKKMPLFFHIVVQRLFRRHDIDILQYAKWAPTSSNISPVSMCLRFRRAHTSTPVIDMFFYDESTFHVAKIQSIQNKKKRYIQKEYWPKSFIFPLRHIVVDDTKVCIPNQPIQVLKQQYGDNVMVSKPKFKITQLHQAPHFFWTKFYYILN
jgi:phosphorylcholine metabolism protein LicD